MKFPITQVQTLGWITFFAALLVGGHGLWFLNTHTTTGSPELTVGLVQALLGFSAASFGITTYRFVHTSQNPYQPKE